MATKHKNSAGSAHILLMLCIVLVVALVGWFTAYRIQQTQKVNKERALYAAADKEAKAYIDAIAAKYPGVVNNRSRCWRTSAKYSEGSLGCASGWSIEIPITDSKEEEKILAFADNKAKNLFDSSAVDTTANNQRNASPNYIHSSLQPKQDKRCSLTYKYKDDYKNGRYNLVIADNMKVLEVSYICSGSALEKYY